jgi:hypothetical protein
VTTQGVRTEGDNDPPAGAVINFINNAVAIDCHSRQHYPRLRWAVITSLTQAIIPVHQTDFLEVLRDVGFVYLFNVAFRAMVEY